jgi:ATP-dependent exoDNAse (exonuclease V) alpha subunit
MLINPSIGASPECHEPSRKRISDTFEMLKVDREQASPTKKQQHATPDPDEDVPVDEDDEICLTKEQQVALDMALDGSNVFLTGAAGCGKTVTIKKLLTALKRAKKKFQVVAPTGIAALPLGGRTLHSFLGWRGSPDYSNVDLVDQPSSFVRKAVRKVEVLIIEEISMVSNLTLERMDLVIKSIMGNDRPFGGKQVIFTGDFYQLPVSVSQREDPRLLC